MIVSTFPDMSAVKDRNSLADGAVVSLSGIVCRSKGLKPLVDQMIAPILVAGIAKRRS